jgi:hypothetical protein
MTPSYRRKVHLAIKRSKKEMILFTVAFRTLIHKEQSITLHEILSPTKFTAELT